jgi:hypothetical protein
MSKLRLLLVAGLTFVGSVSVTVAMSDTTVILHAFDAFFPSCEHATQSFDCEGFLPGIEVEANVFTNVFVFLRHYESARGLAVRFAVDGATSLDVAII